MKRGADGFPRIPLLTGENFYRRKSKYQVHEKHNGGKTKILPLPAWRDTGPDPLGFSLMIHASGEGCENP